MFIDKGEDSFYKKIYDWVQSNLDYNFFVYASQQKDNNFYEFCKAVVDSGKDAVIITNIGSIHNSYPLNLAHAIDIGEKVRMYETSRMAMNVVLNKKAELFVKVNGGIIWTPE